jgi:hypothetical protein
MSNPLTVADVRRITGQPAHVVNYAIGRYGPEPAGRIGNARIWRPEDLPKIRESIAKTQALALSRKG